MKWEGNRESDNVEDRRSGGGGGGGSPVFGGRSIGIGTIVIALVGGWVLGINPLTILGLLSGGGPPAHVQQQPGPAQRPPADDTMARFVSTVLAEPIQTVMRRFGVQGAYEKLKEVTRGKTVTAQALHALIQSLEIPQAEKDRLLAMTPGSYVGKAAELARRV